MLHQVKNGEWTTAIAVRRANKKYSNIFATISHYPSVEMQIDLVEMFKQRVKALHAIDGFSANLVVQSLHKNAIAAMKLRGGNPVSVEADGPLTGKETMLEVIQMLMKLQLFFSLELGTMQETMRPSTISASNGYKVRTRKRWLWEYNIRIFTSTMRCDHKTRTLDSQQILWRD